MRRLVDLDALALFHCVAANGGFGRAARATGHAKATLSRRVADLERQLGVRLFERGAARLRLTDEGRVLLSTTQEPLDELAAAESLIRGGASEPRGQLRVSVPLMLGQYVMGELAARFIIRYPLVRLEIVADDRYVDLVQEGFDLAIRAKPKPRDDLVGRCVLRDRLLVVAHPALERPRYNAGETPARVAAVVRAIGDDPKPWMVVDGDRRMVLDPDPVLRLSTLAIRDAVRAGAGAALFPSTFVSDDIACGRLACWGALEEDPLEFWALHASARLPSRKVRAFMAMVVETFAAAAESAQGDS